jgi:uncharacterized membrane protein YeaQ/YmgE (transglycosylase-associated protein family)
MVPSRTEDKRHFAGARGLTLLVMLILAIILFGMFVGAIAQKILGYGNRGIDWGRAIIAGLVGSFVGGLVISLLAGDGLDVRPSGIIGSILGAVIVTVLLKRLDK